MKLIDVSGYGHSGKTAVTDILREVRGIHAHHPTFEFNLLRLADGVFDLKKSVYDDWSPIRSDFAIKRFTALCDVLNPIYSTELNPNFQDICTTYINSFIVDELYVDWYDNLYNRPRGRLKAGIKFILKKAHSELLVKQLLRLIKKNQRSGTGSKNIVYLIDGENFIAKTRQFLEELLCLEYKQNSTVVTNNAFEPFNPTLGLNLFTNAYCVIVDRDPRDIYLSSRISEGLFIPDYEKENETYSLQYGINLKRNFLGSHDIDTFIRRQKIYRKNAVLQNRNNRIIRVKYEHFVLNYENTLMKLLRKLHIDATDHINKFKYFNPEKSRANVRLWEKYPHISELKLIERELKEYLYE
jgi:hypothetical protein